MFKRFTFIAVAIIAFSQASLAQETVPERLAPGEPPIVVAHRAKGGGAPDNSIAGIKHAIERGIDMIEIDVQVTRDGQYVLMHDATLKENTNVVDVYPDGAPQGRSVSWSDGYYVIDFTLEEIAKLRLKVEDGTEHPVPVLQDVLEIIHGRLFAILEIKSYETDTLAAVLKGHEDSVLLFSQVNEFSLDQFRQTLSTTGIGAAATTTGARDVIGRMEELAASIGPALKMVNVYGHAVSPEVVAHASTLGLRVGVNGIREEDVGLVTGTPTGWQAALESGAAAYLTGQPDELMELLGR